MAVCVCGGVATGAGCGWAQDVLTPSTRRTLVQIPQPQQGRKQASSEGWGPRAGLNTPPHPAPHSSPGARGAASPSGAGLSSPARGGLLLAEPQLPRLSHAMCPALRLLRQR